MVSSPFKAKHTHAISEYPLQSYSLPCYWNVEWWCLQNKIQVIITIDYFQKNTTRPTRFQYFVNFQFFFSTFNFFSQWLIIIITCQTAASMLMSMFSASDCVLSALWAYRPMSTSWCNAFHISTNSSTALPVTIWLAVINPSTNLVFVFTSFWDQNPTVGYGMCSKMRDVLLSWEFRFDEWRFTTWSPHPH